MSGLTVFFHSFLPKGSFHTYDQSTASLLEQLQQGLDRGDEEEEPNEAAVDTENEEGWTGPVSFKEWKKIEKLTLNTYIQHRMLVPEDDDDDEQASPPRRAAAATATTHEKGKSSPLSGSLQAQDLEPQFETQGFEVDEEGDDDKSEHLPSRPPHVDAAIHSVEYLTDLDLHSKETNLKLLTVERMWYFRKTNRPATSNAVPRRQPIIETYQGPVRVPLHPCEDDGPLCCVYRFVLSFEVTQFDKPSSNLRQRAAAIQGTSIRRLKIFAYNGYAEALQTIVEKHLTTGKQRLMLRLQRIPAKCIFPVAMTSWVDFDVSQYCICLGDNSLMKWEEEDGAVSFMRFDTPDVEISAAIMEGGRVINEWKIYGGSDIEIEEVAPEDAVIGPDCLTEKGGPYFGSASPGSPSTLLSKQKATSITTTRRRKNASPQKTSARAAATLKPPPPEQAAMPPDSESTHAPPREEDARAEQGESQKRVAASVDDAEQQSKSPRSLPLTTGDPDDQPKENTGADLLELLDEFDKTGNESNRGQGSSSRSGQNLDHPAGEADVQMTEAEGRGQIAQDVTGETETRGSKSTVAAAETAHDESQQEIEQPATGSLPGRATGAQARNREEPVNESRTHQDGSDVENDQASSGANFAMTDAEPLVPLDDNLLHIDAVNDATPFRIIQEEGRRKDRSPVRSKEKDLAVQTKKLGKLAKYLEDHNKNSKEPCIVHVYAVVVGVGSPSMTKRGEWMISTALVDDSLPLNDEDDALKTININIFAKDKASLPKIRFCGDVLRIHRVQVQEWCSEIQLLGKRASSFVVCRRQSVPSEDEFEWTLLPTSKSRFEVDVREKMIFANLWKWGQHRIFRYPTMKASKSFKISDVQRQDSRNVELFGAENSRGDLTVMVTAIIQAGGKLVPRGFLRVWDGTGPPMSDPLVDLGPHALESVANGDPPDKALVRLSEVIENVQYIRPNKMALSTPISVTGRVVNVAIWGDSHWELVKEVVRVGTFIRLRNVQENKLPQSDLRCLMVHTKSYLTPLPDTAFEVIRLLEDHNVRLQRKDELNPSSGILPAQDIEVGNTSPQPSGATAAARRADRSPSPIRHTPKRIKLAPTLSKDFSPLLNGSFPVSFKGIVSIVGTIPSFPILAKGGVSNIIVKKHSFGIKLEDNELNQIDVIVNAQSDGAQAILGSKSAPPDDRENFALAFLREAIKNRWSWVADIRGIIIDGGKYYTLDSITKYEGEE